MMSRSNAPQVLSVVSQRSTGHSYYVDESNPWPGDFESDNEEREYVNTEDRLGDFEDELEYVNPNGMPDAAETDEEYYVVPVDLVADEDLYETVDELRQGKSIQYNRCKKETKKNLPPDVKIMTESDQLLIDSTQLPFFEIHKKVGVPPGVSPGEQEPIYTNIVDYVPEEFPPPPPIRESRIPPPIPPVPTGPRDSPPPPCPQEAPPPLPIIQTTSGIPSHYEIPHHLIIQRPSMPATSTGTSVPTMVEGTSSSDQKYSKPESTSKPSSYEITSLSTVIRPSMSPISPGTTSTETMVEGTSQSDEKDSEPESTSKPTPATCLLERRPKKMGLESQVWYAGNCRPEEADELLRNATEDGMFLVRKSQRSGQPYTLCVIHQGGLRRFPVRHRKEDGNFALGTPKPDETVFSSVEEIISFYRNNPIEYGKERLKVTLTKAATE